MKKVATLGEILVEILAAGRGQSFRGPGPLTGPYPSGAPAIFIDQVAKLGQPCGTIGCVGDDDFGVLNVERLRADGVDVSAITVRETRPTGTAFVTYEASGDRHFIFNIAHSASGELGTSPHRQRSSSHHGHIPVLAASGGEGPRRYRARQGEGRDDLVRSEPASRTALGSWLGDGFRRILAQTDVLLPSGPELRLVTGAETEEGAVAALLSRSDRL